MKYIFKYIFHHKLKIGLEMAITFVMAFLLFASSMMNVANTQLSNMLSADTDLFFYISGNINNYNYSLEDDERAKSLKAYEDLYNDLKKEETINYVSLESYLYHESISTCAFFDDGYSCLGLPLIDQSYFDAPDDYKPVIRFSSLPFDDGNKRLGYIKDAIKTYARFGLDHSQNFFKPYLIGVNVSDFSDLKSGTLRITEGESFSSQDLENGSFKAIVPYLSYLINEDGVKTELAIGDHFKIGVDDNVYDFEIIGLHNGMEANEDLKDYEITSRNIYISQKAMDTIIADKKLDKNTNHTLGELGSYGAILANVDKLDAMQDLLEKYTPKIKELGESFTYVSGIDEYADALVLSDSNDFIFKTLTIVLIILVFVTLFLECIFNINSRLNEIAIKNSLGAKTTSLGLELFLEYLLVSIAPLALAIYSSTVFAKTYAANEFSYQIMKILSGEYNVHFYDNTATGSLQKKFNLEFGFENYLLLIGIWLFLVILAFVISYWRLKRLNVKEVLLMHKE